MISPKNCKILYGCAFAITLGNFISLFAVGMSRISWIVQLVCEILLIVLLVKEYRDTRIIPLLPKCLLFALGFSLLMVPMPFSEEPMESTFSIAEYEQNIIATQQNPNERALLSSLPKLSDSEKHGKVVSANAIKIFQALFSGQDFYGAPFQLFMEENGQGYMYSVENDSYEYRVLFDQYGEPVEYAKCLVR